MANNKSGKSKRNPSRVNRDRFRSYRNKQEQRLRHQQNNPNEKESVARAKRWVNPPSATSKLG